MTQPTATPIFTPFNPNPFDASRRHTVRVTFTNGDTITTEINGTPDEVCDYYIGNLFNLGSNGDNMQRAVSIEFYDGEVFLQHKRKYRAGHSIEPWNAEGWIIRDAAGNALATLCNPTGTWNGKGVDNANINLMAAAPELLELAYQIIGSPKHGMDWAELTKAAQAAIAKATGE